MRYTSNEEIRAGMYFLIMMPPVSVITSLLAMYIPRSAGFLYAVTTTAIMWHEARRQEKLMRARIVDCFKEQRSAGDFTIVCERILTSL
ncbi:hypothetical protein Y032_0338g2927 [Ancylostoma ceylanicum]|nr:hypothetical protein Y032_0338g2927 [Ancylostoma ceylanicum]